MKRNGSLKVFKVKVAVVIKNGGGGGDVISRGVNLVDLPLSVKNPNKFGETQRNHIISI